MLEIGVDMEDRFKLSRAQRGELVEVMLNTTTEAEEVVEAT